MTREKKENGKKGTTRKQTEEKDNVNGTKRITMKRKYRI